MTTLQDIVTSLTNHVDERDIAEKPSRVVLQILEFSKSCNAVMAYELRRIISCNWDKKQIATK